MNEMSKALRILLEEAHRLAEPLSEQLVRDIYALEERVQFDDDRREAPVMIQRLVRATVEQEVTEIVEAPTDAPH